MNVKGFYLLLYSIALKTLLLSTVYHKDFKKTEKSFLSVAVQLSELYIDISILYIIISPPPQIKHM